MTNKLEARRFQRTRPTTFSRQWLAHFDPRRKPDIDTEFHLRDTHILLAEKTLQARNTQVSTRMAGNRANSIEWILFPEKRTIK